MNCQDFELIVINLSRNQLVDVTTREQSLAHTEICVQCAARLAEERALMAGVRLVVAEIAEEKAPARVEAALLTALRAQAGRRDIPVVKPLLAQGRRIQWKVGVAWAAVILAVILIGLTWLRLNSGEQRQEARQSPARPTSPAPQREGPASDGAANAHEWKLAPESANARSLKTRRGVRQAAARATEVATRFYPLAEEGELVPLESGRVVRVEVPASTLIAFGLPVTAENIDRSVQADLLLGQDGLARAIRFLP